MGRATKCSKVSRTGSIDGTGREFRDSTQPELVMVIRRKILLRNVVRIYSLFVVFFKKVNNLKILTRHMKCAESKSNSFKFVICKLIVVFIISQELIANSRILACELTILIGLRLLF